MAITLDEPRSSTPVLGTRGIGQTAVGMVVDKETRGRLDREGKPIMNSRGKPAQEEVLTIMVMGENTGTLSGGDLNDDFEPEVGSIARLIVKGLNFGKLIDARKAVGGNTQVGDVVSMRAASATIWRGQGDIAQSGVTDEATIGKARAKGLSVGWDVEVGYRRASPSEKALVDRAEALHMERRRAIELGNGATPTEDEEPPF